MQWRANLLEQVHSSSIFAPEEKGENFQMWAQGHCPSPFAPKTETLPQQGW